MTIDFFKETCTMKYVLANSDRHILSPFVTIASPIYFIVCLMGKKANKRFSLM